MSSLFEEYGSGIPDPDTVRWWVAYCSLSPDKYTRLQRVARYWWGIFQIGHPKQFRHCFAFTRVGDGWFIIDPTTGRMKVMFVPDWYYQQHGYRGAIDYYLQDGKVIQDVTIRGYVDFIPKVLPATCVTVVKSLLGLRTPVYTPYGLYKYLRDGGHKELSLKEAS